MTKSNSRVWLTCELEKDKGGGCEHWSTQQCECECHKQPPAPEKKWEERFHAQFSDVLGFTEERDLRDISEPIVCFIASILEEKAVEAGEAMVELFSCREGYVHNCRNCSSLISTKDIKDAVAAAILRR